MMTSIYLFVLISVIRLKIHMMQCCRWFNGTTSSGQQYKIYSLFYWGSDCLSDCTIPSTGFLLWCIDICVCVWPSVVEQSSCQSTGSASFSSLQTAPVFLSFIVSYHQSPCSSLSFIFSAPWFLHDVVALSQPCYFPDWVELTCGVTCPWLLILFLKWAQTVWKSGKVFLLPNFPLDLWTVRNPSTQLV